MTNLMNSNSNMLNADVAFKRFCIGKGCNQQANKQLVVKFVRKTGWFCESCATELTILGLIEEENVNHLE